MDDIAPLFHCAACGRGVLDRRAERCLFCAAPLPAGVRPDPTADRRNAEEARRREERHRLLRPDFPPQPASGDTLSDLIDIVGRL